MGKYLDHDEVKSRRAAFHEAQMEKVRMPLRHKVNQTPRSVQPTPGYATDRAHDFDDHKG